MKIAVLGAGGMLGKAVCTALPEAIGYPHRACDIMSVVDIRAHLIEERVHTVINCAGAPNSQAYVNSLGPWLLSREFFGRIIHVSTDCVFGDAQSLLPHSVGETPIPTSPYGISKALGEQLAHNVMNIRTSFVGVEHGLLNWLLTQQPGSCVRGWLNALWSGSTVKDVASVIATIARNPGMHRQVAHVATAEPISKYDVCEAIINAYDLDLRLEPDERTVINRALVPTHELRPFFDAIGEYARVY